MTIQKLPFHKFLREKFSFPTKDKIQIKISSLKQTILTRTQFPKTISIVEDNLTPNRLYQFSPVILTIKRKLRNLDQEGLPIEQPEHFKDYSKTQNFSMITPKTI